MDNSILALARQQVFDEYIKSKASYLSDWLIECDRVWKEEGTMLPYPSFSFYPDEEDIIARAKILSKPSEEESVTIKVNEEPEEVKEEETPSETKSVPVYYKQRRKWSK